MKYDISKLSKINFQVKIIYKLKRVTLFHHSVHTVIS